MNIIPKCIPDGVDVEKDDLSQVDPETKVPDSHLTANTISPRLGTFRGIETHCEERQTPREEESWVVGFDQGEVR